MTVSNTKMCLSFSALMNLVSETWKLPWKNSLPTVAWCSCREREEGGGEGREGWGREREEERGRGRERGMREREGESECVCVKERVCV